jgi:deoxyribose-phosphate aldolase
VPYFVILVVEFTPHRFAQAMNIAPYIDHTILKPTTTAGDVIRLCSEAAQYGFAAVCLPPPYVALAAQQLQGTPVRIAAVIGFPFGYSTITAKIAEVNQAIADGAQELDIVHNLTALKNGAWGYLKEEISILTQLAHSNGCKVKIIVESGILTDDELIMCCETYAMLGIDFMKTSTGYAEVGATIQAVRLMHSHLPANIAIKASGGIRNFAFAKELVAAGATRLGCSASLQVVKESNE